jgi:hypothetical protein
MLGNRTILPAFRVLGAVFLIYKLLLPHFIKQYS